MKKIKRILSALMAVVVLGTTVACGGSGSNEESKTNESASTNESQEATEATETTEEAEAPESSGGNETQNDKEFTLTVWTHPFVGTDMTEQQTAVFEGMAEDFKKEYPNATIKFEEIPWQNREQKIMTALSSNGGPDVFYLIPDMMTQFANNGILEPLDGHLSENFDEADFSETSIKAVTYDGQKYGLPILRELQTMIYNTDVLAQIGVDASDLPETWEEFDALAAKAKEAGFYARNFEGGSTMNSTLYPYIWQAGGDIVKDGQAVIDSPEGIKAFEEINKQYQNGYIPEDSITSADQNSLFVEGKMMSAFGTGYLISLLEEMGQSNYAIGAPLKEKEQVTFGVTGMFAVAKTSKNPTEAARFVETMTNSKNMGEFCKLTKYIPARTSALSIYDGDEKMGELIKYVDIANPGVIEPSARIFMPNVQAKLQAMLEGSLTPEEAAKEAAEMITNELR